MKTAIYAFLTLSIIILGASFLNRNAEAAADAPQVSAVKKHITIGTGTLTGVYYPAGGAICRLVNRGLKTHGIKCSVEPTNGSIDNIQRLASKDPDMHIDIAVVQSDWQFHAYNGSDYFSKEKPFKNMRSLFSLHSEPFTVIVRKDSGINKFDDIKGKKVNFGSQGSGIRATMDFIIKQKGWKNTDFAKVTELQPSEQTAALCNKDIDVMVYTAGHPNGAVQEVTTTCETKIIPVDGPGIDKMIKDNPFYAYTIIPGGMYNGTPNDVKTIGVKATFITTADMDQETAYQVVKAVFDNFDNFKTLHPVFGLLDPSKLVHEGNTAPIHPGAARYFKEKGML